MSASNERASDEAAPDTPRHSGGGGASRRKASGHLSQASLAAYFHVSTGKTTLVGQQEKRQAQVPPAHPARLSKNDSGSSNNTVTTVEVDESVPSSLSTEKSAGAPKGQLASMLHREATPGSGSSQSRSDGGGQAVATAPVHAREPPTPVSGAFGRVKRGGSGGDSRFGDYKGALMRPPIQSVFGNKPRHGAGDQAHTNMSQDTHYQRAKSMHSGSAETPDALLVQTADGSPANELGDSTRDKSLRRSTSKDGLATNQPAKLSTQQSPPPKAWIYPPPGERSPRDNVLSGPISTSRLATHQNAPRIARMATTPAQSDAVDGDQATLTKSSETIAGGPLHYRRDSSHAPGLLFGTQANAASTGTAAGLNLPTNANTSIFGAGSSGGRVTTGSGGGGGGGGDSGKSDYSALSVSHHDGLFYHGDNAVGSGDERLASSPWSFVPRRAHKKTLKYHLPGRWNAIAPGPDRRPHCAVVGHEGLVVLAMGADKIQQEAHLTSGRRWSMALDFKDVIWRPSAYITTGSNDGTVTVWDPMRRNDYIVRKINDCSRPVNRLAPKPGDPYFVYSAFSDGSIIGWDVRAQGRNAGVRMSASLSAQDVHCNPQDANMVAAITQEGRVLVWDIRSPTKALLNFVAHSAYRGQCIAWHPNGRFIGSGGSDQLIKIWDMKAAAKKYTVPTYCTIKTFAHVNKLQWRPGHDTQISSCSLVSDSRFQIWDMHNPNHSLMYHDQHGGQVTGFSWYDENTVWTISRDCYVVQCDMQNSAIYTPGLMGNTVAAFSPTMHLAMATGEWHPRSDACLEKVSVKHADVQLSGVVQKPASRHAGTSSASSKSDGGDQEPAYMSKFQPNLPESFLDEHILHPDLSVKSTAMCLLARSYRFDHEAFAESCEHNSAAAAAVGFLEIAKFWQFLSALLSDSLPLKSRLKAAKPKGGSRTGAKSKPKAKRRVKALLGASKDSHSETTSRSSSGMYPSRSVIDTLSDGDTSDDGPHGRSPQAPSFASISGYSSRASITPLRKTPSTGSIADALPQMRMGRLDHASSSTDSLERTHMSFSHANLQKALLATKAGKAPSPLSRPVAQSASSPNVGYGSEPLSPEREPSKVVRSATANARLASYATELVPKQNTAAEEKPDAVSNAQDATPQSQPRAKFFIHDAQSLQNEQQESKPGAAQLEPEDDYMFASASAAAMNPAPQNDADKSLPAAKLQIKAQRHATKAELKLVMQSCEYYADHGDVQTAVTVALLMRKFIRLQNWATAEPWFLSYVDQLDQYCEFAAATEILLAAPFESVRDTIMTRNSIAMDCSHCRSTLVALPETGLTFCVECKRLANSCVVCEQPVSGRFVWCQGCGHGGHSDHLTSWFEEMKQTVCPAGCGHRCLVSLKASAL
ncbi:hypothetical protein GQ54DRAFT_278625 [Martensiomyces pterosporus]|nr:hypothetical protein GQ54DRAFT_278625 [Martensiomyces pterosporus]